MSPYNDYLPTVITILLYSYVPTYVHSTHNATAAEPYKNIILLYYFVIVYGRVLPLKIKS